MKTLLLCLCLPVLHIFSAEFQDVEKVVQKAELRLEIIKEINSKDFDIEKTRSELNKRSLDMSNNRKPYTARENEIASFLLSAHSNATVKTMTSGLYYRIKNMDFRAYKTLKEDYAKLKTPITVPETFDLRMQAIEEELKNVQHD